MMTIPRRSSVSWFLLLFIRSSLCTSYVIKPGVWDFRGHPIAYEKAEPVPVSSSSDNVVAQKKKNNADEFTVKRSTRGALPASVAAKDDDEGGDYFFTSRASTTSSTLLPPAPPPRQEEVEEKEPILLLNGFGVGSFHQHRLIHEIMTNEHDEECLCRRNVYCVDYLGQGKSWPKNCNDGRSECERGLRYCGETWVNQIVNFIDDVIMKDRSPGTKVHIVGNSVGGHLAVFVAATRPDLVASLCLLNATPVWGLNLPGWSGTLPAPFIPKRIGRYLFDRIRDINTIEAYLNNAYANRDAFDDVLMRQIRSCTEGRGGHAAFASILWSPPISVPIAASSSTATDDTTTTATVEAKFNECLSALECDVLLLFGRDDPWCKPAFAKRMLQDLNRRTTSGKTSPNHRYVELSNVGHCPNHEAPAAVSRVLESWLDAGDRSPNGLAFPNDVRIIEKTSWGGETVIRERTESEITLNLVDWLAVPGNIRVRQRCQKQKGLCLSSVVMTG